jgi:hypothetical protein
MGRRFTGFILNSWPNTPEVLALDAIAERARSALLQATIEDRLQQLAAGTADLQRASAGLRSVAGMLDADASRFGLKRVECVIRTVTESIQAIRQLVESLDTTRNSELVSQAERIIDSLQSFEHDVRSSA